MLNKLHGEMIGNLGPKFRIVPNHKWRDTPLWNEACKAAVTAFYTSGALLPIQFSDDDILTQEYPDEAKIVFIFHRFIAGKEHLYPYVFELSPKAVAELKTTGRWTNTKPN